jgi:hypothetical protein
VKPDPLRHVRRSNGYAGREVLSLHRPTKILSSREGDERHAIALFVREQDCKGGPVEWRVEFTCAAVPLASRLRIFGTRAEALAFWEALP